MYSSIHIDAGAPIRDREELCLERMEKYLLNDENEDSSDDNEAFTRSMGLRYESRGLALFKQQRKQPSSDATGAEAPQEPIQRRVQPPRKARMPRTAKGSSDEEVESGVENRESAGDDGAASAEDDSAESAEDDDSGDGSGDDNGDGGGGDSGGEGRMGGGDSMGDTHSSAMQEGAAAAADDNSDVEAAQELERYEAELSQAGTQLPVDQLSKE